MNQDKSRFTKTELFVFSGLLIVALAVWGIVTLVESRRDFGSVEVSVNGTVFGEYSLGKDQDIDIGGHNTLQIKDGRAKMIHANCPDQLCTQMDAIDERGGFIACLPNSVLVIGEPSKSAENSGTAIDGAAY